MSHKETFIDWLQNAYGMEKTLVEVMEAHRDQAEEHPDVQKQIQKHIEETIEHANRLEQALEKLDEKASYSKGAWSSFKGVIIGSADNMNADKAIKNSISDFAAEHFEIAAYNALITAANELGYTETVKLLEQNLKDEQNMANWLEKNLPIAVTEHLQMKEEEEGEEDA